MIPSPPSRPRPRRVLVVDDHPLMRLGLSHFLHQGREFVVCGEAGSAAEALSLVQSLRPDLVLLDISLEGRSGLDLLKDLRLCCPEIPVLVHSMHDETTFAERALQSGARGYLMKQQTADHLLAAVRQVLRGEIYLSDRLRAPVSGPRVNGQPAKVRTLIATLSHREFEVFRLIGQGCVNQEIAHQLHISVKTVEAHRQHIKRKLDLASSTALNLLAVRWATEQPV